MTWEPRPMPTPTNETATYWEKATEGKLVLNECADCGLVYHYPRAICPGPDCFSDRIEWIEASGRGTIYSYTVARQAQFSDWPDEDFPIVLAVVELEEGPKMPTVIREADPETVDNGRDVEVSFVETERDDVAIPVFTPASGAES